MSHNRWKHPTLLLVGGFDLQQTAWSIAEGFRAIGWNVANFPSRGRMHNHRQHDDRNRRGESRQYPKDVIEHPDCLNEVEFTFRFIQAIQQHAPRMILWWTCKEDKPRRLISGVRSLWPHIATVYQTQDDPWHVEEHPQYSDEFEYAVTCCKESVARYEERGIKAITLYPPPALELCQAAKPSPAEACDVAFAPGHLQGKDTWPTMLASKPEIVKLLAGFDSFHGYGTWQKEADAIGLNSRFRGRRDFEELPDIYASAKINVNCHLRPDAYGYLNKRALEIPASGGFMLCDHVKGIEETWDIGNEIDTWLALDELEQQIRWWLTHDEEREACARRAQERTLREHGNVAFATKLVDFTERQHELV